MSEELHIFAYRKREESKDKGEALEYSLLHVKEKYVKKCKIP